MYTVWMLFGCSVEVSILLCGSMVKPFVWAFLNRHFEFQHVWSTTGWSRCMWLWGGMKPASFAFAGCNSELSTLS